MAESGYSYLPWVRQGIAGAIEKTDDQGDDKLPSRVELGMEVHLNQDGAPIPVAVRLYGPGDVTGFDARQVVRTDPVHLTQDFEPNYFPLIEFDRPDFPWLFTPAKANAKDQLRPWICLVAVEKGERNLEINPLYPLPILHVTDAQQELPDLRESWAWAHTEVAGTSGSDLNRHLEDNTKQVISRLLCPRRLEPKTTYYACVVPTFEVGRKAGLGEALKDGKNEDGTFQEDATLKPAWDSTTQELRLPVYYHWEFSTGVAGDFESLVWLLERQPLPPEVGARPMRVQAAGGGLPDITEGLWLEGALRPEGPGGSPEPADPETFNTQLTDLQRTLAELLNAATPAEGDLVLPPPIYGRWHAAQRVVSGEATGTPPWLHELNLDPRLRVAAALGTRVVQEQQEQLMAAAWEQVGEIERANQLLRQAQLARAAGIALYREHLIPMSAESLVAVSAPVHSRVRTGGGEATTVAATVAKSLLPAAALSAPFRRVTRARGPLARRLEVGRRYWTGTLVARLNREEDGQIRVTPEPRPPAGMVTMDEVFLAAEAQALAELSQLEAIPLSELAPEQQERLILLHGLQQRLNRYKELERPQRLCEVTAGALGHIGLPESAPFPELFAAFRDAAMAHQTRALPCNPPLPPKKEPLKLDALKETLLARLDPNVTVPARWRKRVQAPHWKPEDPLEPIMAAPEFPAPMYRPLAELSQDLLLPGLEHVPPNTMALLTTNPAFIEAYMVGLNHEMSRELLWREFPTDQRGTYFHHFWDPRSRVPPPTDEDIDALRDIPAIHAWTTGTMGDHLGGGAGAKLVLLIRGDLLRRYPRAVIYAAKAKWVRAADEQGNPLHHRELAPLELDDQGKYPMNEKYPIFQGTLTPDITFLGFDLSPKEAAPEGEPSEGADAGWFIVLQQPPTEPRYGLDDSIATSDPGEWTWHDLTWRHVFGLAPEARIPDRYIKLSDGLHGFPPPGADLEEAKWRGLRWASDLTDSAQIAAMTLQRPFRAAIHASDLLPPKEP